MHEKRFLQSPLVSQLVRASDRYISAGLSWLEPVPVTRLWAGVGATVISRLRLAIYGPDWQILALNSCHYA